MRLRRLLVLALTCLALVTACGDDAPVFTIAGPSPSATGATTTPGGGLSDTSGADSSAATAASGATTPGPTAADALAAFFAAAADLDASIRSAATEFNAGFDEVAGSVAPEAAATVNLLDARTLVPLIPGGLSLDVETAVLAVYADLDSRISALQGATRVLNEYNDDVQWALDCLGLGGTSADRYRADFDAAVAMAALEPPPTAAPDSVPAGVLATRLATIHSMNFGCDSCGGVVYTAPIPIDWDAKLILDGVGFEATYNGTSWDILIYAC